MSDRAGMSQSRIPRPVSWRRTMSAGCAVATLFAIWMNAGIALAADPQHCLTPEQRRSSVANGKALPLARALRPVRHGLHGEVVKARLCESSRGLVYMLTVLARDGKVTSAAVDALHGQLIGGP